MLGTLENMKAKTIVYWEECAISKEEWLKGEYSLVSF